MAKRILETSVVRYGDAKPQRAVDSVATEDPLEIRLGDRALAVTMRTPGDDADLVLGFLLTEGILLAPAEVDSITQIDGSPVGSLKDFYGAIANGESHAIEVEREGAEQQIELNR